MAIREVLKMGDPRLLAVAAPVSEFGTAQLEELITDMRDTMRAQNGAGLAAPQIGVGLRVVIFGFEVNPRYPEADPVPFTVLINPLVYLSEGMRLALTKDVPHMAVWAAGTGGTVPLGGITGGKH